MDMLSAIFILFITSAESVILRQQWTAKRGIIDIYKVRQDCMAGTLLDSTGQLNLSQYVRVEAVIPPELSACTPSDDPFTQNMLTFIGSQIFTCYTNHTCTYTQWNPKNLRYQCPSQAQKEQLAHDMRLKFTINCQPLVSLQLTNILPETTINRNQQLCADGKRKRATHIFLTSSCPKAQDNMSRRSVLVQLRERLNECSNDCDSISVMKDDLGTARCSLAEKGYTAIGVYWSCTDGPPSPIIPSVYAGGSTSDTPTDGEKSATHAVKGEKSAEVKEDQKYLKSLIVVSVALVVVIAILIAVLVYFLVLKGRRQRYRADMKEGPPSRQALYSRISRESCTTSVRSSTRYTPATGEEKMADAPADDYAVPSEECYEEEAAYEVVDIAGVKRSQEPSSMKGSRLYRNGSEKYSNGYLLPTTSQVE